MKTREKKILAFTFVELVVTITISLLIIGPLLFFVTDLSKEISISNNLTKTVVKFYEIENKISEIKNRYLSGIVLINNNYGSGSDVLLFRTDSLENNKGGFILGQVNFEDLKIDGTGNIDNVGAKYLGIRKISDFELNELENDPNKVYDYKFNLDELFEDLILKDFQVETYNTGSILELKMSLYLFYSKNKSISKYSEVPKNEIKDFILNF